MTMPSLILVTNGKITFHGTGTDGKEYVAAYPITDHDSLSKTIEYYTTLFMKSLSATPPQAGSMTT